MSLSDCIGEILDVKSNALLTEHNVIESALPTIFCWCVMSMVLSSHNQPGTEDQLTKQRFLASAGERGPHPIPRRRQVCQQFHRIFSIKAGNRIICAETQLKADAIFWAESQPEITSLCEQPLRIHGSLGTAPHFTFDLAVVYRLGGEVHYLVSPESRSTPSSDGRCMPPHWEMIETWCAANGHHCAVLSDRQLDAQRMLISNWRKLLGFVRIGRESNDQALSLDVLQLLSDQPGHSIHSLIGHLATRADLSITAVCADLLHAGKIDAQLDRTIFTRQTPLSIGS